MDNFEIQNPQFQIELETIEIDLLKETLRFTPHEKDYEELDSSEKIYRRVR